MSSSATQNLLIDQLSLPKAHDTQQLIDKAIAASLEPPFGRMQTATEQLNDLKEVKMTHDVDLFKTQNVEQGRANGQNNVLLLVKFPDSGSTVSCGNTRFKTVSMRLTMESIQSTGSGMLMSLLTNEQHQRRAQKAAAPLPHGITHVLDLSPTDGEDDYILALTALSLPRGVKLWHRAAVGGVSIRATAGHDDVCSCMLPISGLLDYDHGYPPLEAPKALESPVDRHVCIFDTERWPVDRWGNVDDFCTTRWAANTIRLFRTIAEPAGQKSLLIDSAPRLWTLVGLFTKLEMTNFDILRDDVVAWFNADGNCRFVELCPEESLRIGLAIKAPIISEPAFRILVNERALEVAGGQPSREPSRTVFGRRSTSFTGTDTAESTLRMIEHASVRMAERYKIALDRLCSDDALDMLQIPEWQVFSTLYKSLQTMTAADDTLAPVLTAYENWMSSIRYMFSMEVKTLLRWNGAQLPTNLNPLFSHHEAFTPAGLQFTVENVDEMRAFTVPKHEIQTQSFAKIYDSLNHNQRALIPLFWEGLRTLTADTFPKKRKAFIKHRMSETKDEITKARAGGKLPACDHPSNDDVVFSPSFQHSLETSIVEKVRTYVDALIARDADFNYAVTPHLVLALDDDEMNFLRLGNDETTFQAEAPETDMGPSGPGPAYHTGHTNASVSDLDFEGLDLSDDGASTVVGSMAAQDGVSTVYNRHRVQARSVEPSVASEQFTEGSSDFFTAEYAVPADHQLRGQILAQVIKEENEAGVRGTAECAGEGSLSEGVLHNSSYIEDEDYDSDGEQADLEDNGDNQNQEFDDDENKHMEDRTVDDQTGADVRCHVVQTGDLNDDDGFELL